MRGEGDGAGCAGASTRWILLGSITMRFPRRLSEPLTTSQVSRFGERPAMGMPTACASAMQQEM